MDTILIPAEKWVIFDDVILTLDNTVFTIKQVKIAEELLVKKRYLGALVKFQKEDRLDQFINKGLFVNVTGSLKLADRSVRFHNATTLANRMDEIYDHYPYLGIRGRVTSFGMF